jgi:hypothetical protein
MNLRSNPAGLLVWLFVFSVCGVADAQQSKSPLVCRSTTLAASKPLPKLSYECGDQPNDWDEKILKLPARVAAIKTLESELSSFTDPAWWAADVVDLSVCDFTKTPGTLTRDQRRTFLQDEYLFWLFGNDRIRIMLIPDPCYQTQYGGANAFLLYRNGGRVTVTQVLDGFFSRADNPMTVAFAKLNGEAIIELATWSGGLNPSLTNYYFTMDPKTGHAVPKNIFQGDHGPTNEISSAMLLTISRAIEPLKVVRGQALAPSFSIYIDDENGKIDDGGRKLTRKILRWNGKVYQ